MKAQTALIVLLAGLLSACSGASPPAAPPPTSAPAAAPAAAQQPSVARASAPVESKPTAPAAASAGGDPREALGKVFQGWGNVKSFRARMTTSGLPSGTQERDMDVVLPDRVHMTSSRMEAILVDQNMYIKLPSGGWQKIAQNLDID